MADLESPEAFAERVCADMPDADARCVCEPLTAAIRARDAAVRREAQQWRPLTDDPESWPEDGVLVLWRWWHPCDMSSGTRRGRQVYGYGETETGLRVSDAAAWLPLPPPPKGESK